jgi:hypothetical protein
MKWLMLKLMAVVVLMLSSSTLVLATPERIISGNACDAAIEHKQYLAGCTNTDGTALKSSERLGLADQGGYLNTLINVFIYAAGFLAFLFLILGAIRYITSTGDAKRIQAAKDTIMYSLIGLIVVILARLVIGFIIESAAK